MSRFTYQITISLAVVGLALPAAAEANSRVLWAADFEDGVGGPGDDGFSFEHSMQQQCEVCDLVQQCQWQCGSGSNCTSCYDSSECSDSQLCECCDWVTQCAVQPDPTWLEDTNPTSAWQPVTAIHGNASPSLYFGNPSLGRYEACEETDRVTVCGTDQCRWHNRRGRATSASFTVVDDDPIWEQADGELRFDLWLDVEAQHDYLRAILVTPAGTDLVVWDSDSINGSTSGWETVVVDLTGLLLPAQTYRIRFELFSDESVTGEGAYVDNVEIVQRVDVSTFEAQTLLEEDFEDTSKVGSNFPSLPSASGDRPEWFVDRTLADSCWPDAYNLHQGYDWVDGPSPAPANNSGALYFGRHQAELSCEAHPHQHHYYYQQNGEAQPSRGRIETRTLNLPPGDYTGLSWDLWMETEGRRELDVFNIVWKPADGSAEELLFSSEDFNNETLHNWRHFDMFLVNQRGASGQVVFEFDSVDGYLNSYVGTFVDNLWVGTVPPAAVESCLSTPHLMLLLDRSGSMNWSAVCDPGGVAISPAIELPDEAAIFLEFDLQYDLYPGDRVRLKVLTPELRTEAWTTTASAGSQHVAVDLSSLRGKTVELRFELIPVRTGTGDYCSERADRSAYGGASLDNVILSSSAGPLTSWPFDTAQLPVGWQLEGNGCRTSTPNSCDSYANEPVSWQVKDGTLWFGAPGTNHYHCGCWAAKWPLIADSLIRMVDNFKEQIVFGLRTFPSWTEAGCTIEADTGSGAVNFDSTPGEQGYASSQAVLQWLQTHRTATVGGSSPLSCALKHLRQSYLANFDTQGNDVYLLALTDGVATCGGDYDTNLYCSGGTSDPSGEVELLRGGRVGTFVVGFDDMLSAGVDAQELTEMAEQGGHAVAVGDQLYYRATDGADLNDALRRIGQGTIDERCDGIDNDCDGLTDERVTVTGCLLDTGTCVTQGFKQCLSDGSLSVCQYPDELCNGSDDNCDGTTDEPWSQVANLGGVCNVWERLHPQQPDPPADPSLPQPEPWYLCVNRDDPSIKLAWDCKCYQEGAWQCDLTGRGVECVLDEFLMPDELEQCNCIDDDCDGQIDERLLSEESCDYEVRLDGVVLGVCPGRISCECLEGSPSWTGCGPLPLQTEPEILPGPEVCDNGVDDDCDGLTDASDPECCHADGDGDGFGHPLQRCNCLADPGCGVADATDCNDARADVYPGAPELCDDVDNDCDGVDPFAPFLTAACADNRDQSNIYCCDASGGDQCHNEGWVCTADKTDLVCSSADTGTPESCDDIDNDCDGQTNEDADVICQVDADGDGQLDHLDTGCVADNPCACVRVLGNWTCVHE